MDLKIHIKLNTAEQEDAQRCQKCVKIEDIKIWFEPHCPAFIIMSIFSSKPYCCLYLLS